MTALTGVIVPALQAAVQRRAYNLSLLQKKSPNNSATAAGTTTMTATQQQQHANSKPEVISITEQRRRQVYAQENIRKLTGKVARLFAELEQWDAYAPVSMIEGGAGGAGGIGIDDGSEASPAIGLLEGFLEEVISRIEPEDVV